MRATRLSCLLVVLVLLHALPCVAADDPLPAWRDGDIKSAVLAWLDDITREDGPDYIPPEARIAVFDNDGTAACERPHGGSSAFQRDLLRSSVAAGRADADTAPIGAWLDNDRDALRRFGWTEAYAAMNAVFAGMEMRAYRDSARAWVDRNPHPRYGVRLDELYYQPMHELKDLLVAHGFEVWLVTASTQEFIRSYAPDALGIPVGRVIGTWTDGVYEEVDGRAVLRRGPVQHNNGYENKPGNIETRIGRRPVFAAGNSNNDEPMLRWALTGDQRGFGVWIHHDDSEREYDYDRGTDRIADLVDTHPGAHEVSMERDWARIFSFAGEAAGEAP